MQINPICIYIKDRMCTYIVVFPEIICTLLCMTNKTYIWCKSANTKISFLSVGKMYCKSYALQKENAKIVKNHMQTDMEPKIKVLVDTNKCSENKNNRSYVSSRV